MRILLSLIFVLTSLPVDRLKAATPLDRVRKDAGLCVVVDDLPDRLQEFRESALRKRLESLMLFQRWEQSPEYSTMQNHFSEIRKELGHAVPDALSNLAGDQLVLAVYPQMENEPAGMLISSPRDHGLALKTVDLWNRIESAELTEQKSGYWKRSTDNSILYYLLTKNRFALSDREELIRELAMTPDIPRQESVYEAPGWHRAQQTFDDRSWIRIWFRPEIWKGIGDFPEEKPGLEMVLGQLKRSESVILEFDSEDGLHASLHLLYKADKEPQVLVDYRTRFPEAEGILEHPSGETLFFLAGHGGFAPLARLLASGWPDPQAKELRYFRTVLRGFLLGRDPYEDVLPRLGKLWSIDVRRSRDGATLPVDLLLQIRLENDDEDESLSSALENLLSTGLRILRDIETDAHGGDVRTVEMNQETRLTVYRSLSGWEPSFLVDERRVMIASSEDRLRDAFHEADLQKPPRDNPFRALADRSLAAAQLGVLLNLKAVRSELVERPDEYLELFHIPRNKRTQSLVAMSLFADTLQLFDGGYLLWNCRKGEWSLHLGTFLLAE
jgi:hypothetical protein